MALNWWEYFFADLLAAKPYPPNSTVTVKGAEAFARQIVAHSSLDTRSCGIINLRYGANGKRYSNAEIASIYGVTSERIRVILLEILKKVRENNDLSEIK